MSFRYHTFRWYFTLLYNGENQLILMDNAAYMQAFFYLIYSLNICSTIFVLFPSMYPLYPHSHLLEKPFYTAMGEICLTFYTYLCTWSFPPSVARKISGMNSQVSSDDDFAYAKVTTPFKWYWAGIKLRGKVINCDCYGWSWSGRS